MKKHGSIEKARRPTKIGTVIGRDRFAKISAIEGVELTEAAKMRAAKFENLGLSADERIRAIVAAHRKG